LLLERRVGRDLSSAGAEEVVVSAPGSGVEEVVVGDKENTGELLVVVGHHDVLGLLLGEVEEGVDILNGAEGLLPELKLNGNIELLEAGVQMTLESVGVVQ